MMTAATHAPRAASVLPTLQQTEQAYRVHGLQGQCVAKPSAGRFKMLFPYDGVPYCLDHGGRLESVFHGVLHRQTTIERHHALVKAVFDYAQERSERPMWVMCGDDDQLVARFADEGGCLAILYLTTLDRQDTEATVLYAPQNGVHTLVIQRPAAHRAFYTLDVVGVRVKAFGGH